MASGSVAGSGSASGSAPSCYWVALILSWPLVTHPFLLGRSYKSPSGPPGQFRTGQLGCLQPPSPCMTLATSSLPSTRLQASHVSHPLRIFLGSLKVCGVSLVWPPSASTACGFLLTTYDALYTVAILPSWSSYMDSDLLSAMENLNFTEEEATVITEIPAEDEDYSF
ncbi:hypothetical protein V6N13_081028 [Hibiscus sabdariffa]